MREERGKLTGLVIVYEHFTLWGSVAGDVKVIAGGKFYIRGAIYGNLMVEEGGRVHVYGNVSGNVTLDRKTKVILSGIVGGDVTNNGGRLYVENTAQILGKMKARSGETTFEPKGQVRQRDSHDDD